MAAAVVIVGPTGSPLEVDLAAHLEELGASVHVNDLAGGADIGGDTGTGGARHVLVVLGDRTPGRDADPMEDPTGTGVLGAHRVLRDLVAEPARLESLDGLVVLSGAMVYGAWANNPVPLTEAATLRPSSSHPAIVGLAEAERLAAQLADDHPDLDVAVLRPTVTVHPDRAAWLAASPWSARGLLVGDVEPPAQYLHRDDLVSAIALVALEGHSGAFNVAPDGWLGAEQVRELAGPRPRAVLPAEAAEQLRALRWQFDRTGTSPELAPWVRHPWVVSSDRLRALGWVPRHRNEEVFVEATPPGRFGELDAGARQRLALGVIGAVVVGAGVAGVAILRWRRRVNGRRG